MRVVLEIVSGPSAGQRIELTTGEAVAVGRSSRAKLSLPADRSMAGLHFELECTEKGCLLRALTTLQPTLFHGNRIREQSLQHGDQFVAGENTFSVIMDQGTQAVPVVTPMSVVPPVTAHPAAKPVSDRPKEPKEDIFRDLLGVLRQSQPLYALIDAARDPAILEVLQKYGEAQQPILDEGETVEEMAEVAPYLVRLPPQSAFLEALVSLGWGQNWGIYFTCAKPDESLYRHLKGLFTAEMPDGEEVYFRLYDPRVLRQFLPACSAEETTKVFGPISAFLVEDKTPSVLWRFTAGRLHAEREMILVQLPPQPKGADGNERDRLARI
jgi:hypothetical protein